MDAAERIAQLEARVAALEGRVAGLDDVPAFDPNLFPPL